MKSGGPPQYQQRANGRLSSEESHIGNKVASINYNLLGDYTDTRAHQTGGRSPPNGDPRLHGIRQSNERTKTKTKIKMKGRLLKAETGAVDAISKVVQSKIDELFAPARTTRMQRSI